MLNYLVRHAQTCVAALGKLYRQPIGSLLTIAVIGIALALPAGLNVLVRNGELLAGGWDSVRDFTVYLQPGAALADAEALGKEISGQAGIDTVSVISAEQALAEFRATPGVADMVGALDRNPLPHSIIVRPAADTPADSMATLAAELATRKNVDQVRLDTEWVARLNAIIDVVRRMVWIAGALLIGAVVVIIGNTIRLDIQNQRAEIEVAKLLGATDGFVRRPFLYSGFWYGLAGGLLALLILLIGLALMRGPVTRLSALYAGGFSPVGLDGTASALVLGGGLLVGLVGAWLAVSRHLAAIQPKI